ncbi:hypothetical protein [Rhodococcus sp. PD04]|uniref:hypothetical protein n=1 Tax=Rhodococcus sp. PD04 TaxID=3109594 RepID=UPI002DD9732B|nr:hypothetical protein [Rhodococcus sp. PD04]WSE25893.1 hypothetical protein U9J23_27135 [Rhodococcus sp. PD04]
MAKMTSGRPDRFGGGTLPPAFVSATAPAATAPAAVEPSLTAVPETTPVAETPAPAPSEVEEAPEPKAAPEPTKKKSTTSRSKRVVESTNSEVRRKYVEWDQSIEDEFQDGCDDWYGDRDRRERKRRLGRRPSDNAMVIALMRLGLETIAKDPKANDRLEDLLPVDARRRRKS